MNTIPECSDELFELNEVSSSGATLLNFTSPTLPLVGWAVLPPMKARMRHP